jgi:hypothetical protein
MIKTIAMLTPYNSILIPFNCDNEKTLPGCQRLPDQACQQANAPSSEKKSSPKKKGKAVKEEES